MTETDPASVERPRDIIGLLVWLAAPLRPVLGSVGCAAGLVALACSRTDERGERGSVRRFLLLALLVSLVCLLISTLFSLGFSRLYNLVFMQNLTFDRTTLMATSLAFMIGEPVLWIGLACGYFLRRAIVERIGFLAALFDDSLSIEARTLRFLGLFLIAAIVHQLVEFVPFTVVMAISHSLAHESVTYDSSFMTFLLIRSGVSPVDWDPIEFPAARWVAFHVTTQHLRAIVSLWAWSAVVAFLCVRLPSWAIAIPVSFALLMAVNCLGMAGSPYGLNITAIPALRAELAALAEALLWIPTRHGLQLIMRAESLAIATTILALLAWRIRGFLERAA